MKTILSFFTIAAALAQGGNFPEWGDRNLKGLVITGRDSLDIGKVSAVRALPSEGPGMCICNVGYVDVYVVFGATAKIVADKKTGLLIPPATCAAQNLDMKALGYGYIAGISDDPSRISIETGTR